jgi:phage portal protein BeeE
VWPFTRKQNDPDVRKSVGFSTFTSFTGTAGMGTNPEAFAREGYLENAVVAACVRLIASAGASVDLQIAKGPNGKIIAKHPMLDLMTGPNPMLSDHEYIEAAVSHS